MFASCSACEDYHLMQTNDNHTLCGLVVAPIIIDRPVNTEYLHLTSESPADKSLCPECATIDPSFPTGGGKSQLVPNHTPQ
jgi:hypothetical protein